MKSNSVQLLLVLTSLGMAAMALPQNQTFIAQDASGQTAHLQHSAVRIVHPRAGQALANDFVALRFELARPNPAGGDNHFVIQLDGRDAVTTSEAEYTFTGMGSGQHTISVTEVDANGTPLPDARAEVQFTVKPPEGTVQPAESKSKAAPGR